MTQVWTHGGSTSLPAGPTHLQVGHGLKKEASDLAPSPHQLRHYLRGFITQLELHNSLGRKQSVQRSSPTSTRTLSRATQGSDTKTLRSLLLLLYLQLDSMIPVIHGSDYAVRFFFSRFERCNPPISMRATMNGGRYLCMVILQSSSAI